MSERKTSKSSSSESRVDSREALLDAAKRVFAQRGFEGATVKDLADAAGVNVSLVSYHFGGKEGLYRTCLMSFGMDRLEAAERVLSAPMSREDFKLRLKIFADELVNIHLRDRDTCKMIHRALDTLDATTADVFKSVFFRVYEALHVFIRAAQENRILRADLDPEVTTVLMFGSIMHFMRSQEIARVLGMRTLDDPEYRRVTLEHWVGCFTDGIFENSPTNEVLTNTANGKLKHDGKRAEV